MWRTCCRNCFRASATRHLEAATSSCALTRRTIQLRAPGVAASHAADHIDWEQHAKSDDFVLQQVLARRFAGGRNVKLRMPPAFDKVSQASRDHRRSRRRAPHGVAYRFDALYRSLCRPSRLIDDFSYLNTLQPLTETELGGSPSAGPTTSDGGGLGQQEGSGAGKTYYANNAGSNRRCARVREALHFLIAHNVVLHARPCWGGQIGGVSVGTDIAAATPSSTPHKDPDAATSTAPDSKNNDANGKAAATTTPATDGEAPAAEPGGKTEASNTRQGKRKGKKKATPRTRLIGPGQWRVTQEYWRLAMVGESLLRTEIATRLALFLSPTPPSSTDLKSQEPDDDPDDAADDKEAEAEEKLQHERQVQRAMAILFNRGLSQDGLADLFRKHLRLGGLFFPSIRRAPKTLPSSPSPVSGSNGEPRKSDDAQKQRKVQTEKAPPSPPISSKWEATTLCALYAELHWFVAKTKATDRAHNNALFPPSDVLILHVLASHCLEVIASTLLFCLLREPVDVLQHSACRNATDVSLPSQLWRERRRRAPGRLSLNIVPTRRAAPEAEANATAPRVDAAVPVLDRTPTYGTFFLPNTAEIAWGRVAKDGELDATGGGKSSTRRCDAEEAARHLRKEFMLSPKPTTTTTTGPAPSS